MAEEAVSFVNDELGIPATVGDFLSVDFAAEWRIDSFSVLTMWYVIEHFSPLAAVLEKVNKLLRIGGVFAFSTPNLTGVSGRTDKTEFLRRSPVDHFSILCPKSVRKILPRFGLQVVGVRITGHHPERFKASRIVSGGLGSRLLGLTSRMLSLGDTFEVYAKKMSDL